MAGVSSPEHPFGFTAPVPFIDLLDGHDRQELILQTAKGNLLPKANGLGGVHRQCDRDGKHPTALQPHLFDDAVVILFAHEAVERRESTHRQQLEVAHRPFGNLDGRKPASLGP